MKSSGYMLIMLIFVLTLMSLALMVAAPVWETQVQREKEEELIFRGKQFVEAVRLYQLKKPGRFPDSLEVLLEEKCLRRPFRDPMTAEGEWNIILRQDGVGGALGIQQRVRPDGRMSQPASRGQQSFQVQKVLVAPLKALSSIRNAQILGVVSSSTKRSIRIYNDQESYEKWLFFYGQDPQKLPEIIYYGESAATK
ncbi:MAG: hypothetical protein AB1715_11790 [Acidobacteriota bacterium]